MMKQLAELIPIILFFVVYKMDGKVISTGEWSYQLDGIYSATAVLMITTVLQLLLTWLIVKKIDKRLIWVSMAILLFGGATLWFRNELFIQWKPTVFNWVLAAVFFFYGLLAKDNLIKKALGGQLELPDVTWSQLNLLWIANFLIVGALNLYVAYSFSESFWVSYKLYSSFAFTIVLMILTALIVAPHLKDQPPIDSEES